jgi:hypothetical protein
MRFQPAVAALLAALLLASVAGCQKSGFRTVSAPPTVLSPDTIAHVQWLGKKQVGIMAGAYYFSRIWQQPASAQLEKQTLYKLATNPGNWLPNGSRLTSDYSGWLWQLLNDVVQEQSYLEIRQPAGSSAQSVFAIRLSEAQSGEWFTNLSGTLEPLTGTRVLINPVSNEWTIKQGDQCIRFTRVGDWTLISSGPSSNPLTDEIAGRIRRDGVPFVSAGTNLWLEADLDLPRLAKLYSLSAGGEGQGEVGNPISHLTFSLTGDGGNVITRAKVTLTNPLPADLAPWHLPLDFLHEPLTSLTAVRGLQSSLAAWPFWQDLQIGAPPDQFYVWSLGENPYALYAAAPLPEPRRQFPVLMNWALQSGNPWLATNGYVNLRTAPDGNGLLWGNQPDLKPFVKFAGTAEDGWLLAGLTPDTNSAALPPPPGLVQDILRRTNLVYYDWEVTGPRLQPTLQFAQTARQIARQPDLSLNSASLVWLGSLIPRLGTSATIIVRTGPAELTLTRRSTIGLTSVELHLLTGWLESPNFPR